VRDPPGPGYSPVPKDGHPLVPGTIPAEVAAHWECRLIPVSSLHQNSAPVLG